MALVAGPLSPLKPLLPLPATVVMKPVLVVILRMQLFCVSAINRLPAPSRNTLVGELSAALVAGPPSPPKLAVPSPATVVMMPVLAVTLRMRLLPLSAINKLPAASTATPLGRKSWALVASPPSPPKPPLPPLPATVVMMPVLAVILRMR